MSINKTSVTLLLLHFLTDFYEIWFFIIPKNLFNRLKWKKTPKFWVQRPLWPLIWATVRFGLWYVKLPPGRISVPVHRYNTYNKLKLPSWSRLDPLSFWNSSDAYSRRNRRFSAVCFGDLPEVHGKFHGMFWSKNFDIKILYNYITKNTIVSIIFLFILIGVKWIIKNGID